MDPHSLADKEFMSGFEACALPPAAFNHRGHLRIAWVYLRRFPIDQAVDRVCRGIERFAAHLDVPGKYSETLTAALVRLMARGGAADPALSFSDFLCANPDLVGDAKGVLARHSSPALLESADARRRFLPPDRAPLPE